MRDMVWVPREPTPEMLAEGEGITDFILPDCFDNSKEGRLRELKAAWEQMIECWERHENRSKNSR